MRYQHVLNLKRTDPISAGFDNIVFTSDIPEIAVRISPADISRMEHTIFPGTQRILLCIQIPAANAVLIGFGNNHNLAVAIRSHFMSVFIDQTNIILRARLSDRTDPYRHAR